MTKTNKRLLVAILISSLFMCVAYAEVTNTVLSIVGEVEAIAQTEVFITDATTTSGASTVNGYLGTVLDTKTVLGATTSSTVSYDVTLYNSSEKEYVFIGVLKHDDLYSNTNIDYTLTGLTEYETTISPKQSLTFTITFKYAGTNVSNNTLESKLNFRFREKPEISLSNEGEEYTLENIYPGYEPQEYKFTVSNVNTETGKINNVPMKYTFETTIEEPLEAKIYEGTKEITGGVALEGEKEYTLKIVWDESKNSSEYSNKEYSCKVVLKAKPTNTDYAAYEINKEFNIKITTKEFTTYPWEGSGTEESPYLITNEADLRSLAEIVNSGEKFTGVYFQATNDMNLFDNLEQQKWTPIGNSAENYFDGTIDFSGNSVTQMFFNDETGDYKGMFGHTGTNSVIKNLTLEPVSDIYIQGIYVGGIVGYNEGSIISCTVESGVEIFGTKYVGGIAGYNSGSISEDCSGVGAIPDTGNDNINFTIDGVSYIANPGWTWDDWINSGYNWWADNYEEYTVSAIYRFDGENYYFVASSDGTIIDYLDGVIEENYEYTIIMMETFTLIAEGYYIEEGVPYELEFIPLPSYSQTDILGWNIVCPECWEGYVLPLYSIDGEDEIDGLWKCESCETEYCIEDGEGNMLSFHDDLEPTKEYFLKKQGGASITITGENKVMVDSTIQLTATLLPENATDKTAIWTSSDESIATVDSTGLVTGKAGGKVTITVEIDGVRAEYNVNVIQISVHYGANGGGSYTSSGYEFTIVARPKLGYQLSSWVIQDNGCEYEIISGSLTESTIVIRVDSGILYITGYFARM